MLNSALNMTVAEGVGVSKELSLHPVHLTADKEGKLPPSALVPFCSYQMHSHLLGQRTSELDNLTICDKFEPTILEGQLCYSLNTAKVVGNATRTGRRNGLLVLLDPSPFQINVGEELKGFDQTHEQEQVRVYVHTLSPYTAFGAGEYAMSALKRMKGTESFKQLPDSLKNCQVHNKEECETKRFLDRLQSHCNCIPWALVAAAKNEKVK